MSELKDLEQRRKNFFDMAYQDFELSFLAVAQDQLTGSFENDSRVVADFITFVRRCLKYKKDLPFISETKSEPILSAKNEEFCRIYDLFLIYIKNEIAEIIDFHGGEPLFIVSDVYRVIFFLRQTTWENLLLVIDGGDPVINVEILPDKNLLVTVLSGNATHEMQKNFYERMKDPDFRNSVIHHLSKIVIDSDTVRTILKALISCLKLRHKDFLRYGNYATGNFSDFLNPQKKKGITRATASMLLNAAIEVIRNYRVN